MFWVLSTTRLQYVEDSRIDGRDLQLTLRQCPECLVGKHTGFISGIFFSEMEIACFTIGAQRTDHSEKEAKEKLVINLCSAFRLNPSEICLVESQEVGDNWFNLTFKLPNKTEVLDQLRWAAINKDPGLCLCGVKAVRIGNESQIVMQPITRSLSLTIPAGELLNLKTINKLNTCNTIRNCNSSNINF